MAKNYVIWLTRPLPDSTSLATELDARGIRSIISPVMRIEMLVPSIPTAHAPTALLLTSRYGVHALSHLPAQWRNLPVYCVGRATAARAQEQHFTNTITGEADALTLMETISAVLPAHSRLLYLTGDETRVDVVSLLASRNIEVEEHWAYRAHAAVELSSELRTALADQQVDGVTFFSPRSAKLACELLLKHNLDESTQSVDAFCLSLNVVQAAARLNWRMFAACHRPTRKAMVELVVSHTTKT